MACKSGCGEFHWDTEDAVQTKELEYEKQVLEEAVGTAQREVDESSWNASNWLQHHELKLAQVKKCLVDSKTAEIKA